jgi:hypothetical protein
MSSVKGSIEIGVVYIGSANIYGKTNNFSALIRAVFRSTKYRSFYLLSA